MGLWMGVLVGVSEGGYMDEWMGEYENRTCENITLHSSIFSTSLWRESLADTDLQVLMPNVMGVWERSPTGVQTAGVKPLVSQGVSD